MLHLARVSSAVVLLLPLLARLPGDMPPPAPPPAPSWEVSLIRGGEPGQPFVIEGRVLDPIDSRPMRDVLVYAYHTVDHGPYSLPGETLPHLRGVMRTNVVGGYRIRTVLPGTGEGIPHVRFESRTPDGTYRALTLTLCRNRGAGTDTTFARLPQRVKLPDWNWAYVERRADGAFHATFDLPLARVLPTTPHPEVFTGIRR